MAIGRKHYLECFKIIDKEISKHRKGTNTYKTIDDLPLSELQKRCVLEWLAWKAWDILIELGIEDGYGKSYDPLLIEADKCHSYIFDLGDGGRHHDYETLREIEEKLMKEVVEEIKEVNEE